MPPVLPYLLIQESIFSPITHSTCLFKNRYGNLTKVSLSVNSFKRQLMDFRPVPGLTRYANWPKWRGSFALQWFIVCKKENSSTLYMQWFQQVCRLYSDNNTEEISFLGLMGSDETNKSLQLLFRSVLSRRGVVLFGDLTLLFWCGRHTHSPGERKKSLSLPASMGTISIESRSRRMILDWGPDDQQQRCSARR